MRYLSSTIFLFLLGFLFGNAQQITDIEHIFSNPSPIQWSIPIPSGEALPVEWHLRSTSMDKEGIRTFVGYGNNTLVGTLSMDNKGTFKGSIFGKNGYELNISNDGNLVVAKRKPLRRNVAHILSIQLPPKGDKVAFAQLIEVLLMICQAFPMGCSESIALQ